METIDRRERAKRRHRERLGLLRQRAAIASVLGFAAFLGLAAQHAVGSSKRSVSTAAPPRAGASSTYFDERSDGFAFDDGSAAAIPPPVAQTSVS